MIVDDEVYCVYELMLEYHSKVRNIRDGFELITKTSRGYTVEVYRFDTDLLYCDSYKYHWTGKNI